MVSPITTRKSRGIRSRAAPSSIACIVVVAESRMINDREITNFANRDRPKMIDSQYMCIPNGRVTAMWYTS